MQKARAPRSRSSLAARPTAIRGSLGEAPSFKSLDPAAARWIGALIRVASPHPAMTRVLDVIERLQDRPYRTNFLLSGEPGTGKDGLGRALAGLAAPRGPVVRLDVAGFPEEVALGALCGRGKAPGAAEAADGGTLIIEEVVGLPARVQEALLRLLKAGRVRRLERDEDVDRHLTVNTVALTDRDPEGAVAEGLLRHDLYHRIARVNLWLPPLRERPEDIGPAAIWMGNRILAAAGVPLDLFTSDDLARANARERSRAIELRQDAIDALAAHSFPGNLRELEVVLERALLLYRAGLQVGAEEIRAALAPARPR